MTKPLLQIRGIRKQYGPVVAVQDVNLDVQPGEFMTFLGPSGSGKSTTLYILAGFEQPTSGDILLNGESLLSTPSHKRNIGMVFQRYTLFPHLSVGENIAFPLKVRRKSKAEIDAKVKEMLRLVRLEGFEDRKPAQMSGGQQQRVALARALAYDPPVLLMDEPLSALDNQSTQGSWRLDVFSLFGGTIHSWSLLVVANPPRLTISDLAFAEGNSGTTQAVFTVRLSNVIDQPVTVNKVVIREAFDRITGFRVQTFDSTKNAWVDQVVAEGDAVSARQPIVVVEAMKMENELRAPGDGVVVKVPVQAGQSVEAGAVLAVLELRDA